MPETENHSTGSMSHPMATAAPDTMGTPVTGATTENSSRIGHFMSILTGRLNRMIMILLYPFMVIFTVITLLLVITFCVFPTLICMTIGVCVYYCMIDDPIPLSVLLQYMLSTDPDENPFPDHAATQSRSSMQAKLIIRKVLRTEDMEYNDADGDDDKLPAQKHPRNHPGPIEFTTRRKCLYFSEPILYEDTDDHSLVDKSSGGNGPLNQRHHDRDDDLDLFQGNALLQLSSVLATPPDDDEIGLVEIAIGAADSEDLMTTDTGFSELPSDDVEGGRNEASAVSMQQRGDKQSGDDSDHQCQQSETKSPSISGAHGATATDHLKGALEVVEDYFGITDSRECGTTCDICLLCFEEDDEVAWSPNLDCVHSYHKDCILDWLQRQPSCPSCRRNYLEAKDDKNV